MSRSLSFHSPFPGLAGIDGKRVAANSVVVAVHVLAFALLLIPPAWESPPAPPRDETVVVPDVKPVIPPRLPTPPPVQPVRPVRPQTQTTPPVQIRVEVPPMDTAPLAPDGDLPPLPDSDVGPPVNTYDPGPMRADLALDVHPAPKYPSTSIRRHEEGTVLLRVLVDELGRPAEVSIESSSGHRDLDRAARDAVLQKWRFQPAQRDGQPVQAWGLVPIRFVLP